MKKYKAVFFDWDGTAVIDRRAPVDEAVSAMQRLLGKGVYLFVISGTTYENIGDGHIERYFSNGQRKYLFFGLGRGSHNYGFDEKGALINIGVQAVTKDTVLKIHDVAYDIHQTLFREFGLNTDMIFSRPNYVKIDMISTVDRSNQMYLSGDEILQLKDTLQNAGYHDGLAGLTRLAEKLGRKRGITIKATCDAKYLEVGVLNKSDNVDVLITHVLAPNGIATEDCCFWGDEYLELDEGVTGSDSFMYTELSKNASFFDVGTVKGKRPAYLTHPGGSIDTFLRFLDEQSRL